MSRSCRTRDLPTSGRSRIRRWGAVRLWNPRPAGHGTLPWLLAGTGRHQQCGLRCPLVGSIRPAHSWDCCWGSQYDSGIRTYPCRLVGTLMHVVCSGRLRSCEVATITPACMAFSMVLTPSAAGVEGAHVDGVKAALDGLPKAPLARLVIFVVPRLGFLIGGVKVCRDTTYVVRYDMDGGSYAANVPAGGTVPLCGCAAAGGCCGSCCGAPTLAPWSGRWAPVVFAPCWSLAVGATSGPACAGTIWVRAVAFMAGAFVVPACLRLGPANIV